MLRAIIFVAVAALLIWGGIWYNRTLDLRQAREVERAEVRRMEEETRILAGFEKEDLVLGNGEEAGPGNEVRVHYAGTFPDGVKFDSSYDRGAPFTFRLGERQVILGWELGVLGMKVGGKRRLTIPPELAYGERGFGAVIPPGATLLFEIELLEVK